MKTIQRTISLEPMTSRVPSVWPAYKDDKLYFFDDASLKKRQYEYPTNYGMIPLSFSFTSETYDLGCSSHTISFERLCDYYSFFKKYNHLLKSGHCGRIYSSALDYYNSEIDSKYSNQMEYGTNEETYIALDEEYEEKGGDTFFNWIKTNVIPTYEISNKYKAYWGVEYLYYPDVIKWISWFNERMPYYQKEGIYEKEKIEDGKIIEVEHWNCKADDVNDCCDCEEYFNRGGQTELSSMKEWYNNVQEVINGLRSVILDENNKVLSCYTPSMIEEIELQNSLEDIGQYSVLSPNFENGIDYRVCSGYGISDNTKSGTTVIDESGSSKILKPDKTGFCFSPFYMEKIFDETAWDSYTSKYISGNPQEFVSSSYTYYAFDDENRIYVGDNIDAVSGSMKSGETYTITETKSILINGGLIRVETSEYGVYDANNNILGGRTYFVYREKDTSTPYTLINGKKIYADSYLSTSGVCYYFSFFPKNGKKVSSTNGCNNNPNFFDINNYKTFGRHKSKDANDLITYILYNDTTQIVKDSGVTINDIDYPLISGYTYIKDGNILYTSNGEIYDDELLEAPSIYELSDDGKTIFANVYNDDVIIYNAKEITGHTISKLTTLEATNKLCDDIGNDIQGIYNESCIKINNYGDLSGVTYVQPPMYTRLEPLYQIGNTSLIGRFKLTQDDATKITNNTNYFIGNIITNMEFYYNDVNGDRTAASAKCSSAITSLSAITIAEDEKARIDSEEINIIFDENLYCDIEYHIGATLKRVSGKPFTLAEGNYNYGVKYNETVKFVKTPTFYGLKMKPNDNEIMPTEKYATKNLSHKYVIYTYELKQDLTEVENDIYNVIYQAPLARFTTEINLIDKDLKTNFSQYEDMDDYNNTEVSPIFKEEYKMGLSMKEKVDSDIYIDRGINAAFERHLKLGEVTSLEALTQFGNGYFKIMDT